MDLVLFGIQGSGKGTQALKIAQRYGLTIFETGGELRRLSKEDSPLGKKVKTIIEAGKLVPNEIVMEIIENFMNHQKSGTHILFDGIPRQNEQAQTFTTLLKKQMRDFTAVVIDVRRDEALKRLTTRRVCPQCKAVFPAQYDKEICEKCGVALIKRSDDNTESIAMRLELYEKETFPVITAWEKEKKIHHVNGEQSIDNVSNELFFVLDPIYRK